MSQYFDSYTKYKKKYDEHGIPVCRSCHKSTQNPHVILNKKTLEDYYLCSDCNYRRKYESKESTMVDEVIPNAVVEEYKNLKQVGRWLKIKQIMDIPTLELLIPVETRPRHLARIKATIKKLGKK